ncbi:MAG: tripartite tricarboxylate transporter substrate binding protein [Burkholderiaceae bacterium]|nr:tripartite tricarboxylate transporter substrate binding protein [Burkholderiaceae bacterium]
MFENNDPSSVKHTSPAAQRNTTPAMSRRSLLALAAAVAAGNAWSQSSWPERPISLVLGFAPGGPNDLVARLLAKRLGEQLKQAVVVENKPGANGNIAAALVSHAAPDGYTFLYNSSSLALNAALYTKTAIDPLRDLVPVNGTAALPLVCVVAESFPAKNFKEWAAQLKANPGKFNFGSPGNGNLAHVAAEMVLKDNGLQAVHAPYKGSSEALQGLLAGSTQFQFDSVNSPLALIKGGRLRPLFVTSSARSPLYPDVMTLKESGAQSIDAAAWQGVMAPPKTPAALVQRMAKEIASAMTNEQVKAALDAQGAYATSTTPEQYSAFVTDQVQRFRKTVNELGLKLD